MLRDLVQSETAVKCDLHLAGHGLIRRLEPQSLHGATDERGDNASPPFAVDVVAVHAIKASVHKLGSPVGQRLYARIEIHESETHLFHDISLASASRTTFHHVRRGIVNCVVAQADRICSPAVCGSIPALRESRPKDLDRIESKNRHTSFITT
jgi:hypothetical protein